MEKTAYFERNLWKFLRQILLKKRSVKKRPILFSVHSLVESVQFCTDLTMFFTMKVCNLAIFS